MLIKGDTRSLDSGSHEVSHSSLRSTRDEGVPLISL